MPGLELVLGAVSLACRDRELALWEIVKAYLVTRGRKGASVSPRTLETYRDRVEQFCNWATPAGVQLLRPKSAEGFAFIRGLESLGLSASTVQVRLSGARTLYAALRWSGATDASPFTDVRAARSHRAAWEKRGPYSDQDVEKLLGACDPQEHVAVLLAADCGLRNSELTAVQRTDLRLADEHPHLMVRGKGRVPGSRASQPPNRAGHPDLPPHRARR